MRTLRTWFVLFLALAWVPITSHCKFEAIPGLAFLACDDGHTDGGEHCDGEGCCTLESSSYKIEEGKLVCPPAVFHAVLLLPAAADIPDFSNHGSDLHVLTIPPDLPRSWQFLSRAALPVRAPSLAS